MSFSPPALLLIILFSVATGFGDDTSPLPALIEAVARNETHYRELEMELTADYPLSEDIQPFGGENIAAVTQLSITVMGDQFRHRDMSTYHRVAEVSHSERINVFDGRTWRNYSERSVIDTKTGRLDSEKRHGRVSPEWPVLTNLARPHMFLIETGCPNVPLSVYMSGSDAVAEQPNPGYFPPGNQLKIQDLGNDRFQELECRKILIVSGGGGGQPHNGWELWLAKERNFIPVRNVAYTYRWSNDIPVAESVVDEWKELRPGVWFPVKAHTDRYDSVTIKRQGKQKLRFRKDYEVLHVSLDPATTSKTFTELEFPPGTEVETIDEPRSD